MLNRRNLWLAALTIILTCLLPSTGLCKLALIDPRDPYLLTTITLDLDFAYEWEKFGKSDRSRFAQAYDLKVSSHILDPRLIVWDAGIIYRTSSTSRATTSFKTEGWTYKFSTTVLRKLKYPGTFYFRRMTNTNDRGTDRVTDVYGIKWQLNFIRLPTVKLKTERYSQETNNKSFETTKHELLMNKKTVRTDSRLRYKIMQTEDVSNNKHDVAILNFTSRANLSLNTRLNLGTVHSSTDFTSTVGISMGLSARPGRFLRHSHNYTLTASETSKGPSKGTENEANYFNGVISWNPPGSFASSLNYTMNNTESTTPSITSETKSFRLHASVRTRLRKRVSFKQSFSLRGSEQSSISTVTKESSRDQITTTSTLGYSRKLIFANFSTAYGLGFDMIDEQPTTGKTTRLTHNLRANFRGVNLWFAGVNILTRYHRNTLLEGNAWEESREVKLTGSSKLFRRYVLIKGSYLYRDLLYSNPSRNRTIQAIGLQMFLTHAKAKQFFFLSRRTRISVYNNYQQYQSLNRETVHWLTLGARINHNRRLFNAPLNLSANFTHETVKEGQYKEQKLRARYLATYTKTIRGIKWKARLSRKSFNNMESDYERVTTSFKNSLTYKLRAWSLTGEYSHNIYEYAGADPIPEDLIFFKAHRQIRRAFY